MAQFIAKAIGARGMETRLGHKSTGVQAVAAGWHLGGKVTMKHDEKHGDIVCFYRNSGSADSSGELLLEIAENGEVYVADALKTLLENVKVQG